MKLETRTTQILRNFSSINPSIIFTPGNVISTVSPTKTILAKAKITQEFKSRFAIYDLSRFLGTISLFDDPELDIHDKYLTIKQGLREINYNFADENCIAVPPSKNIVLNNAEVSFSIKELELQELIKALSVLSLPDIAIVGDGETMSIQATDCKNPTSDNYSLSVGETSDNFKIFIKAENFKVIIGDYDVSVSSKGISHFKGVDIEYWIAVSSASTFGN